MARHYTDDDLVLYYYGEARRAHAVERHLERCGDCAARLRDIAGALDAIGGDTPARDERYGLEVWQRIRPELPAQEPAPWASWRSDRLAFFAAAAVFVIAAFLGGRYLGDVQGGSVQRGSVVTNPPDQPDRPGAPDPHDLAARARYAAIGDHLERSERVLLDLVNAGGRQVAIGDEQTWARQLIADNRLYRESAAQAGDADVALVLDDLERSLLDIVHEPSTMTRAELDALGMRLDAAALLFKVRVLADELREREQAPAPSAAPPFTTRTTT